VSLLSSAHPLVSVLLKRLGSALLLLWGITVITFVLLAVVPGDPAAANLSQQAYEDPEIRAAFEKKWGLDKPLPLQYVTYMANIFRGDLGTSQQTGRPVLQDLQQYIPATFEIAIPAMLIAAVVAVLLGMFSALRKSTLTDNSIRVFSLAGLSPPPFWLALGALYLFFYLLGWVPSGGRLSNRYEPPPSITGMYTIDALLTGRLDIYADAVWHLLLPVLILALLTVSALLRFVRAAVLEVLGSEFIRFAVAKGVPRRTIIWRHLFRAALLPILTVTGLMFASLLGGAVLVEQILNWPGLGQYAYKSALSLDLQAILGVTLFIAVVYTVVNLVVDLLAVFIDPRVGAV